MMAAAPRNRAGVDEASLRFIDDHLVRYVSEDKIAGALTLISVGGETVHFSPLGLRDRERNEPMTRDTVFRIYSMSKPITSVALMQLYERGRVQLDDPVERYIPGFRDLRVMVSGTYPNFQTRPADRPMTVRDLLTHQSGLTYGFEGGTVLDDAYREARVLSQAPDSNLGEMAKKLSQLPLQFSPGDNWNYSVSTDVVGYLVEVISGKRFDRYLQEHIFGPLGMKDTGFSVRPDQADRFAANYAPAGPEGGLRLIDDPKTSNYLREQTFFSGGGGLVSTAADYLRFCEMLLNGGHLDDARILGRKTIELMTANHLTGGRLMPEVALGRFSETPYAGMGFGLGFAVMLNPAEAQVSSSPGEYTWGGAASTAFWIDPAEQLIVIFMTQLMPSTTYNFRRELRSMVYGALD